MPEMAKGFFERAEGYDEARSGAVCIGEDEALFEGRVVEGLLLCNHGEMGGVDEGVDERDMGVAAVVFGVGEDGEVGVSKSALYRAC